MSKTYPVYIVASRSRALYVGVTGDLLRRIYEHRSHAVPGHTSRYRITRLVHFEQTTDVHAALTREKEIKGWRRSKKVALIRRAIRPGRIWRPSGSATDIDDSIVKQEGSPPVLRPSQASGKSRARR